MLCTAAIFPLGMEEKESRHASSYHQQHRKTRHSLSSSPEGHTARQQLRLKERRSPIHVFPSFNSADPHFNRTQIPLPFDILTDLPIELSLSILSYLSPQDLIRVCLVCRKWYNLAHDRALKRRRLAFVRNQRLNFQLSKENYITTQQSLPQRLPTTPSAVAAVSSRPVLSPVNFVESHHSRPHSEPHYFQFRQPSSPSWSHLRTPGSAFSSVVDGVERLSLKPEASNIRRCLFPEDNEMGVSRQHLRRTNRRPDYQGSGRSTVDLVVCKRTNKSRLRRL